MQRASGILLHITSLPGPDGIGDLGAGARDFIDFLAAAGQRYWQFLPICPTGDLFDNSPYMSPAAFAGNPLLIDLRELAADGLLTGGDLDARPGFSEYRVRYEEVRAWKTGLLNRAHAVFEQRGPGRDFEKFLRRHRAWLDDYALFMSLKEEHRGRPWYRWNEKLARHEEPALAEARRRLSDRLRYYRFEQFVFFRQWEKLKEYAGGRNIGLIGDIPIYVSLDSIDVWANQELFKLDRRTLQPTVVAGVPPDYFSDTGQRWGNPIYRWRDEKRRLNAGLVDWWTERFRNIYSLMDIVRVDHFRGFESCWEIPARDRTAVNGRWVKGPGRRFFRRLEKKLGGLPIIAEDLGYITPAVEKLRAGLGYPGMKILQFAFESGAGNPYLPHNYRDCRQVVYTGTHDNDTTMGWFLSDRVSEEKRQRIRKYVNNPDDRRIHWHIIRLALASVAELAVIPLQDVLGFGSDCRMNTPSTDQGNWRWRCAPRFLTPETAGRLREETGLYGRLPVEKHKEES